MGAHQGMVIRVLLITGQPPWIAPLITQVRRRREVTLIGHHGTLGAAKSDLISLAPDAVVIDTPFLSRPELSIFLSTAQQLGVQVIALGHCNEPGVTVLPAAPTALAILGAVMGATASSHPVAPRRRETNDVKALFLIGCSTGGVEALHEVLPALPADCPPTLVVQHTSLTFGGNIVRQLKQVCRAEVVYMQETTPLRHGQIVLAAGLSDHMVLSRDQPLRVELQAGDPVSGHRPAIDVLFRSAVPHARNCAAALLTGMGADGAHGLLQLRRAGARTVAQDAATSVVYGMPRVAWETGAAEDQVPLKRVAQWLQRAVAPRMSV